MAINKNAKIKTKLVKKEHTGKLLPHAHTSYGGLLMILFTALLFVLIFSKMSSADQLPDPPPGQGSYQIFAVVPAPIPSTAPQITNLNDGMVFKNVGPIIIKGTCPSNTLVKIFKNNVMSGATFCQAGTFLIQADLFEGNNTLIARAYNVNDVPAPDSNPVIVSLNLPAYSLGSTLPGSLNNPAGQFYITSDVYYRGVSVGDSVSWPITIAGGQSPYAVNIGWGDGTSDLLSKGTAGIFNISHVYTHPASDGYYNIFINATDQNGDKSYLQLVVIVSGNKQASKLTSKASLSNQYLTPVKAAELIGILVLAVISFWIGEKREISIIKKKNDQNLPQ